jgi:hypothetical protein
MFEYHSLSKKKRHEGGTAGRTCRKSSIPEVFLQDHASPMLFLSHDEKGMVRVLFVFTLLEGAFSARPCFPFPAQPWE